MRELLSISIPTYNRSEFLSALLLSINEQFTPELKALIHIYIFDNASSDQTEMRVKQINIQFNYTYQKHPFNIGAKKNINHAYTNTRGKYTWVLGDDELLPAKSLFEIIRLINKYSPALIIPSGSLYDPSMELSECYKNYAEFCLDCLEKMPALLIGHSLISSNIIRSEFFDSVFAAQQIDTLYSHFFALTNGIIDKKAAVVHAKAKTLIVRPKRAAPRFEAGDNLYAIVFEQNRYLNWLLKKLRGQSAGQNEIIDAYQKNMIDTWQMPCFQKLRNSELQTLQSVLFDNELRERRLRSLPEFQEKRARETREIQSICRDFDDKAVALKHEEKIYLNLQGNIHDRWDKKSSTHNSWGGKIKDISGKKDSFKPKDQNDIPISVILAVYNEAERIPYVLESTVGWADEIVVFNKSSTDQTKKICLQFGDRVKVIDLPYSPVGQGDLNAFSKVPANDWIYFATASEIPTMKLIERIKLVLNQSCGDLDLIYVPRKYYSFGIRDPRSPWCVSYFPFLFNRNKTIISNTIHKNFSPRNPRNTVKIEFSDDCCVFHLTHPTARDFLKSMSGYFEVEADGCENPAARIKECMANIAKYETRLRNGGNDLLGHYFAWQLYWMGTALFVWEKWRGIDVKRYYRKLRAEIVNREWLPEGEINPMPEFRTSSKVIDNTGIPRISVLVWTLNSGHLIRGCLENLLCQTIFDEIEIIIVDRGLAEGEALIIQDYQKKYSNIKFLKTDPGDTNFGAWNHGIRAASGKYISVANAGDRLLGYAYERMIHVLETETDIALVYADAWITETENQTFENFTASGAFCRKDFDPLTLLGDCYIGSQPMWRKNLHDKYGLFDESFQIAGDWEFWLRIARTEKLHHLKEFLGLCLNSPGGEEPRKKALFKAETQRIQQQYGRRNSIPNPRLQRALI